MRLIEINWNPSDQQLRQFGFVAMIALPLAGWYWSGVGTGAFCAAIGAGVVAALVGLAQPRALKPAFVALCVVTAPIGMVVSEMAMVLVFLTVFLPIGIVLRLFGRDPLQRHIDRQASTYWEPKKQHSGPVSYLRQW